MRVPRQHAPNPPNFKNGRKTKIVKKAPNFDSLGIVGIGGGTEQPRRGGEDHQEIEIRPRTVKSFTSRAYSFTINNPGNAYPPNSNGALDSWKTFTDRVSKSVLDGVASFVIAQEERGENPDWPRIKERLDSGEIYGELWEKMRFIGTFHIQGYIVLNSPSRIPAVKDALGTEKAHLEASRGTAEENITYCTKESYDGARRVRLGHPPVGQGHRSDLQDAISDLESSADIRRIGRLYPSSYVRYGQGLERLLRLNSALDSFVTRKVICLYGDTGTGKTSYPYSRHPHHTIFRWLQSQNSNDYALGYQGQVRVMLYNRVRDHRYTL